MLRASCREALRAVHDLWDMLADPDARWGMVVLLLGTAVALVLGVTVHEAGHALAGRAAGYRIRLVRIGQGPVLLRLPVGLGLLVWRLLPVSGAVATYRPFAIERHRYVLLLAGGALANVAAAGGLLLLVPLGLMAWPLDPAADPVLVPVLLAQGLGVLNLVPIARRGTASDGRRIWQALRRPARIVDPLMQRLHETDVVGRYPGLPLAPPSRLGAVVLHAVVVGTPEASFKELDATATHAPLARDRLRARLLDAPDLGAAERATLLDARITDALLGLTPDDPARLDAPSDALLALVPDAPSARATRGAVLVRLGRPEGRALLEQDLGTDTDAFARGLRGAYLAWARLDTGDGAAAASLLADARVDLAAAGWPALPLVAGLEAALAEAAGGPT